MTIVRYDPQGKPKNRYPREIVSPPSPSACCLLQMKRTGSMQRGEGGWPYFYKRCETCGYTVRELLGYGELARLVLGRSRGHKGGRRGVTWRTWIERVFAE